MNVNIIQWMLLKLSLIIDYYITKFFGLCIIIIIIIIIIITACFFTPKLTLLFLSVLYNITSAFLN